jgi:benzoyl-CoA reductase/2-hydroxyglutaryl-CoA dehydratase subunit BcrC/BadD/HgdB
LEIFCSSPWVPFEWIVAHGLHPRGVWSGFSRPSNAGSEGICAFAQQLAHFPATHPDAALIFTTACDQMRRAADAAFGTPPRIFLFNLPCTWQTPAVRRLYHQEIQRLGRFLVRLGGCTPTEEKLESVLLDWDRRRQQLHKNLLQLSGRQTAEMLLSFFDDGQVPDTVPLTTSPGVPLALVGGPLLSSQLELFDVVESVGGRIVLNAAEPGERCLLPPLSPRLPGQTSLEVLADHYFEHGVDVYHRPNSRLYDWLGARLQERRVRGIVLRVQVGCDLWRAESASLREAFNLPVLVLDEHEARGVDPRDLTRLATFVESLP